MENPDETNTGTPIDDEMLWGDPPNDEDSIAAEVGFEIWENDICTGCGFIYDECICDVLFADDL